MSLTTNELLGAYNTTNYQVPRARIGEPKISWETQFDSFELSGEKGIKERFELLARGQAKLREMGEESVKKLYSGQLEALALIENQFAQERETAVKEILHIIENNSGEITADSFKHSKLIPENLADKANDFATKFKEYQEAKKAATDGGAEALKKAEEAANKALEAFRDAADDMLKGNDVYKKLNANIETIKSYAKEHKINLPENVAKNIAKATEQAGEKASKGWSEAAKKNGKIALAVGAGAVGTLILCKLLGGSSQQAQQ